MGARNYVQFSLPSAEIEALEGKAKELDMSVHVYIKTVIRRLLRTDNLPKQNDLLLERQRSHRGGYREKAVEDDEYTTVLPDGRKVNISRIMERHS